jgi:hypothetical protein
MEGGGDLFEVTLKKLEQAERSAMFAPTRK